MADVYSILEFAPTNLTLYSNKWNTVYFLKTYCSENKRKICCIKNSATINFNEDGYINDTDNKRDLQTCQRDNSWEKHQRSLFTQRQSIGYIITNVGNNNGKDEHTYIIISNNELLDINGCNINIDNIPALHTYRYGNPTETIEFYLNFKPLDPKNYSPAYRTGNYIMHKNNTIEKTIYKILKTDSANKRFIVTDIFKPNSEFYIYYLLQYTYTQVRKNDPIVKQLEEQNRLKKDEKKIVEIYNFNKNSNKKNNKFKPGDKVLCRDIRSYIMVDAWSDYWCLCTFSHVFTSSFGQVQYIASGRPWDACIPYNKYTEELIGTKNDYVIK